MINTLACWRRGFFVCALTAAGWGLAADSDPEEGDVEQTPPPAVVPRPVTPPPRVQPGAPIPPAPLGVPTAPRMNGNEVLLNFQSADIQAVVKAISQMTNRNFLLDPRVKGQITIISAKPVPRAAAYQIFLSALKAQGFTAVEGPGGLVKIIPIAEAKQGADVSRDNPRGGEQMVSHVAILQNISPTQVIPVLRPLMAPTSQLSAYEGANALILTDYADNVRRMLSIIDRLDQPIASDVTVVPLKNASALDLADLIARLAGPPGGALGVPGVPVQPGASVAGDRFTIIPDLRTNSLLIRTENPGRLAQLQSLINKLDVPATTGGQTRVIYLRNAEAVKLAEVLRGLLAGEARAQQATAPAALPGGVPAALRPAGAASRAATEASLVQADEATNALIINASDAVYNNLRAVIEKLDVRRAQVFVEALIAEITTDKALDLGFQWAAANKVGNQGGAIGGITNFPNSSGAGGLPATIADPRVGIGGINGLSVAFLGKVITLPNGQRITGIGALARALESNNVANILSTPNLVTLDNAEAKIVVGQNVPFVTGSFLAAGAAATTTSGANPFQTIDRKDIGIQLKIKPQISEGGSVRLDIAQEISTVTSPPAGVQAADIITNKRSVETKVLVDDGSTIVLGGLIEDRITETRNAVPLLGRIPLLGALFRSKNESKQKTNLMIFLRPTILRTVESNYRVTTDRYEYMHAQPIEPEAVTNLERLRPAAPAPKPVTSDKDKEKEKGNARPGDMNTAPAAPAPSPAPAPAPTPPSEQQSSN